MRGRKRETVSLHLATSGDLAELKIQSWLLCFRVQVLKCSQSRLGFNKRFRYGNILACFNGSISYTISLFSCLFMR